MPTKTNEEVQELLDHPYVEYLISIKTRKQARGFLVGVGSLVLAVLAYAGLEFRSVRAEMAESVQQVEDAAEEIGTEQQRILEQARQVDEVLTRAQASLASAQAFQSDAEASTARLMDLVETNIETAGTSQRSFFELQGQLLQQASTLGAEASLAADNASRTLQEIQDQDLDGLIQQGQRLLQEASALAEEVDATQAGAEVTLDALSDGLSGLRTLEQINERLIRTSTSELFLLRERREYSVTLPDIDPERFEDTKYTITFRVSGIGSRFTLEYRVEGSGHATWYQWEIDSPLTGSDESVSRPIEGTPFTAVLLQRYYGFFSPEFLVLRVQPT
jgi:hypothetical protein